MHRIFLVLWIAQIINGNILDNRESNELIQNPENLYPTGSNSFRIDELHTAVTNLTHRLDELANQQNINNALISTLKLKTSRMLQRTTARLDTLTNRSAPSLVAFHAGWVDSTPTITGNIIKYEDVKLNVGNAYNNITGKFTAPLAGIYLFITTNMPGAPDSATIFELMVDGDFLNAGYNTPESEYYSQSTIQGIVHLNAGQQVWVLGSHSGDVYNSDYCSFSGFLIAPDAND